MEPTVYLDNAATTPVRAEVREAMEPYLWEEFGNPSSPHTFGRAARAAVEDARRRIATVVGVEPGNVLFTSGGTEADNLAIIGMALAARERGRAFRIALTAIEHKAVIEAAMAVQQLGGEMIVLPVDESGRVDLEAMAAALETGVAAVSAMWVNNEIGVTQDIPTIAELCERHGTPFHTDAVQAWGKVPCSMQGFPISCMALSAHKIGGPKGTGVLIVADRDVVEPIIHGGGQQYGLRPGTENVAGIVGMGVAMELAGSEQPPVHTHTRVLRDDLERRLQAALPNMVVCGPTHRAPHISNLAIPGTDSGSVIMHLDLSGICCSSGSACASGSFEPSHVLTAIGLEPDLAVAALRFSFSKDNTREDVDAVVEKLPPIVDKVRNMSATLER